MSDTASVYEDRLTPEQREHLERGIDKRCRMLTAHVRSEVRFDPDGARLRFAPFRGDVQETFTPLPIGYRVEREGKLHEDVNVYLVQHPSFRWVDEGQFYPVVEKGPA